MTIEKNYRNTVTPSLSVYDDDRYIAFINLNYDWLDDDDDDRDEIADAVSDISSLEELSTYADNACIICILI
jgi:hypothetical protein